MNCIKINGEDNPKYHFLSTTDRKFRKIELRGGLPHFTATRVIDIVRQHSFHLVKLSLVDVRFSELTTFAQILNCLTHLEKLTVFRTEILNESIVPVGNEVPLLPKLEILQIAASQYGILKCLTNAKLKTLKVINSKYSYSHRCDTLEDFLMTQDKLKELALRSVYTSHSMLFSSPALNFAMPFQLTRLSLLYMKLMETSYKNLVKFVEKHSKSLLELELGHQFPPAIYECLFNKMTHLTTLNIMIDEIPQDEGLLDRLKKNLSIKNLTIKQTPGQTLEKILLFRSFLNLVPNVTSVSVLPHGRREILDALSEALGQLKLLQLNEYVEDFCNVYFPSLNALHISLLFGKMRWETISRYLPRLTELTVQSFEVDLDWVVDDCRRIVEVEKMTRANVHLQILRFGDWFKADANSLEVLRKNCPHLKVLELHKDCAVPTEPYDPSWVGVLRYCEDHFFDCYTQSPFWYGYPYDDEDTWDGGEVIDVFDYNVMDMPIVGRELEDNVLAAHSESEESDQSLHDPRDLL